MNGAITSDNTATPASASLFLAYSRQDIAIAGNLAARLQAAGHDAVNEAALRGGAPESVRRGLGLGLCTGR